MGVDRHGGSWDLGRDTMPLMPCFLSGPPRHYVQKLETPLSGIHSCRRFRPNSKHRFYDILPSTTAVFSYATGSTKLSANEQFFVGAQTVVGLLQTTQIKQGVSFIAASKVNTGTNKTTIVWIETELSFLPGVDASHVYVRALALGCFYSHISTRTFRRALTAWLDSCSEIKSAPSVA